MPIHVECSGCGKQYKVGDSLAGKQARCACGKTVTFPASQPARPGEDAANEELDESLYDVIAAGNRRPDQEIAADNLPGNLLDGIVWDTRPKKEPSMESTGGGHSEDRSPVVPPMLESPAPEDSRRQPPASEEAEAFWDRFKSPSRQRIASLAIGYGAAMACLLLAMMVRDVVTLSRFSELAILILIANRSVWIALAALIAVGGVLIRKRHPLGPPCAGIASVATSFSWLWSLLWNFYPLYIFLPIFAVQFPFIHAVPVYVTYWCLKEENAREEADRRNDLYAIRDELKQRRLEENRRRWESK